MNTENSNSENSQDSHGTDTQTKQIPKIGDTRPATERSKSSSNKSKRSRQKSGKVQEQESKAQNQDSTAYKGRYQMFLHRGSSHTHVAVLQGKQLTEYSISRDDYTEEEIFGNVYKAVVRNIYPGTEMAFLDIGTSKNAVLHRGDMVIDLEEYDAQNVVAPPIDEALRPNQHVLCQIVKNPIAHKGARLTQEISLPGRYIILIPNRSSLAISRSISDSEKKRLRRVLGRVKPAEHGIIVRTAAGTASDADIKEDIKILVQQWDKIKEVEKSSGAPSLIYRGADATFRSIRDKFNEDYRSIVIDNFELYEEVANYLENIAPQLVDRVHYHDIQEEGLSLFEKYNVSGQLQKSLDKRVWLPSGGEIVIERTEALTVVDVNTAKNTGTYNLEDTALKTNMEAAVEIVRQLRLRDIGGIIVIDFIDLRDRKSKTDLMKELRDALSQDPTNTHVNQISDLGIVQLTRKRIGEDLLETFSDSCETCSGTGYNIKQDFLDSINKI